MNNQDSAVIYRPQSALFWVFIFALVIGALGALEQLAPGLRETLDSNLVLVPVWLAFICGMVKLLLLFDPMRAGRRFPQVLCAGAMLGGTTALTLAIYGNSLIENEILSSLFPSEFVEDWGPAIGAPLVEELSKVTVAAILLLLCAPKLCRLSHALVVGMFVGLGFDLMEDLSYGLSAAINSLESDLAGAAESLAMRIATAVPSHWAFTGLSAAGLMLLLPSYEERAKWQPQRRVGAALALFFCAWLMHFFWNSPAPDFIEAEENLAILYMLFKFTFNICVFLGAVRLLLREEQSWVAARIAEGRKPGGLLSAIPAPLLGSLKSYTTRRALRVQAQMQGGRKAARRTAFHQKWALDVIQNGLPPD